MYETCFNLTERPFASVPRVDHYYPAAVIDAARNTLTRCVERGEGVGMVIGPSGTGKSLLCLSLAERFQKTFQVALLASTHLDTRRSLLQAILYALHRPYRGLDEGELRLALLDFITLSDDCNRGVVLLVDEAHHLPLRLLDEIRALTNLTRDKQPAVRLVLAGSHVLEERFASPKLESFSQRISARCYLEAFQRSETEAYIQTRISACGGRGADLFPAETCQMVQKATDGVPRLINQVCDHALLLACTAGVRRIEPVHVEEAWADLQQLPTPWNAPTAPAANGVIEFGGLDDGPLEVPPIAGTIMAAENADSAADPSPQATLVATVTEDEGTEDAGMEDPETFAQLCHIQKLLADVQAEFQPAETMVPEAEPVLETPHPFGETFAEEEVIADRYAAVAPAEKLPSPACRTRQDGRGRAPCTHGRGEGGARSTAAAANEVKNITAERDERRSEKLPSPFGRGAGGEGGMRSTAVNRGNVGLATEPDEYVNGAELEVAAATIAAIAEEPPPRPTRSFVPPPRPEFGRLFAKLRRGL